MKKTFFITLLFTICSLLAHSQSYLGTVNKIANLRNGPGSDYDKIKQLKIGTQVFIISTETENEYYNVINIATNEMGFLHQSCVKKGQLIHKNESGMFSSTGTSDNYNPDIEIFNNTNLKLTLKLNSQIYTFLPHKKQTISIEPGDIDYLASAPGVMPNYGTEIMNSNRNYTWEFFISTTRR